MTQPIPSTMRALVLTAPGAYEIQDVPVPRPDAGEVLCQVGGVAICGSDPEVVRGDLAGFWPPAYPFIPGHEWSGQVVAVGTGVVGLQIGDRVAGQAHKGCGICAHCLSGRYTICENYGRAETGHRHYGFITPGAYAQYIAVSVKSVNQMPGTISFREGAMVDPAGVVMHGLELSGVTPGGTTRDRQFTLETVNCLGACALGPIVVTDGEYSGQMTAQKVDALLKRVMRAERA